MLSTKNHMGMRRKHFAYVIGVVLAGNGQQDSPAVKVENCFLKCDVGTARVFCPQSNAVSAVFSQNTTPKGVIQVQDKTFLGASRDITKILHVLPRQVAQHGA